MKIIGSAPMSKFDFNKLRQQVKQTAQTLRKEFKATDVQLEANANRGEEWKQNNAKKNQKMAMDPQWLERNTKRNQKKSKDINWLQANKLGSEKRRIKGQNLLQQGNLEEYKKLFGAQPRSENTKKKMSKSASDRWAKTMRKVYAGNIIYKNLYEAAEALGIHPDTVRYRIKSKPNEYYYID